MSKSRKYVILRKPAPPMTDDLVGLIERDDHARGCEGRWYACSCGYEARIETAIRGAAARIEALEGENRELSARLDDVQILLTPAGNEWSGTEPAWQSEAWHMIERTLSDQIDRAALAKDKSYG